MSEYSRFLWYSRFLLEDIQSMPLKKRELRDFPGSSVVRILPFNAGAGCFFSFLVRKLRSHMTPHMTLDPIQKQYSNKLRKDFKNGPHQNQKPLNEICYILFFGSKSSKCVYITLRAHLC